MQFDWVIALNVKFPARPTMRYTKKQSTVAMLTAGIANASDEEAVWLRQARAGTHQCIKEQTGYHTRTVVAISNQMERDCVAEGLPPPERRHT